jgi:hypothetical protein
MKSSRHSKKSWIDYEKLAVAFHGVEILGFKENVNAFRFQLANRGNGIDGVSREAADALI